MSSKQLAERLTEIAMGSGALEARCERVAAACEAAEYRGMPHDEVLATVVMTLVGIAASIHDIVTLARRTPDEHPADGRFTR